jgi:hypothetical protein
MSNKKDQRQGIVWKLGILAAVSADESPIDALLQIIAFERYSEVTISPIVYVVHLKGCGKTAWQNKDINNEPSLARVDTLIPTAGTVIQTEILSFIAAIFWPYS